jgi:hypothetical protein
VRLTLTNDEAYELVTSVAAGEPNDISEVAAQLRDGSQPR